MAARSSTARTRRNHDDGFKSHCVALLETNGGVIKSTCREIEETLGVKVAPASLRDWRAAAERGELEVVASAELTTLGNEEREELAKVTESVARKAWAELDRRLTVDPQAVKSIKELATVAGIATDKTRLLQGKPTERTEQVHTIDTEALQTAVTEWLSRALPAAEQRIDDAIVVEAQIIEELEAPKEQEPNGYSRSD